MSVREDAEEARRWAAEAHRCARISERLGNLAIALAVAGVALSVLSLLLKHGAVGKDGVCGAAPVVVGRKVEADASAGGYAADGGASERLVAEPVHERGASLAHLADGERQRSDVRDEDCGLAVGTGGAKDSALWLVSLNQMVHGTDCRLGAAFSGLCGAACVARVKDRNRERGEGNDKCNDLHAEDSSRNRRNGQ